MFRISCKNSVLQCEWEGLPRWARLGGLSAGASQGCDRFPLLQKGHGAGTGSLQLPAWSCPPSCSSLTPGAGQSSGHSSCTTARLRSKHRHISQTLWDANLISLFTLSFQVSHNKSQPMLGNPPTTWVSVSPMLFQGHPLLQTNLSVSGVTDHFSA